jgi:hypothetical protein
MGRPEFTGGWNEKLRGALAKGHDCANVMQNLGAKNTADLVRKVLGE